MVFKMLFQLVTILQLSSYFCASFERTSHRNENKSINVLAAVFPPFTYSEGDRGIVGGIDLLLLKIIAEKMNLWINLDKIEDFDRISTERLE